MKIMPHRVSVHTQEQTRGAISGAERSCAAPICKADVTRDDSQRRFLALHSIAMLEQRCKHSKQCRNNASTLRCAKNRRCESSRVTLP